jgi:hypothetical protein
MITAASKLKRCLPDDGTVTFNGAATPFTMNLAGFTGTATPVSAGSLVHTVNGVDYRYIGPYLPINSGNWVIGSSAAIHNHNTELNAEKATPRGIFMTSGDGSLTTGYHSYLFPRSVKLDLTENINFLGGDSTTTTSTLFSSYNETASRSLRTQASSGDTAYWMDGCNLRVKETTLNSCNVSATIQVIKVDANGNESVAAESNGLKIQLIRSSTTNFVGQETLYTAMARCSSNRTCGSDECCFNERCVTQDLVSACFDDTLNQGNLGLGETCSTDFDCSSLCCDPGSNRCNTHDNTLDPQVLCQKPSGSSCVSKEWCQQERVETCYIVKTGTGTSDCSLRCYFEYEFGSCENGICRPPSDPAIPPFDPANPDCTNAIDPPVINTNSP